MDATTTNKLNEIATMLRLICPKEGFRSHTTATLKEARAVLAATSSGEFVFFAGGYSATGPSDQVNILNVSSGIWRTTALSQPRTAKFR
jgi:hypothetical protein